MSDIHITELDALLPSILDKAFRGELVPQDALDEPAHDLFKKLQGNKVKSRRKYEYK